ncbi:glycoside hydrolase [Aspergillus heteromorphus CBS 117.55]|uniref:Glycoside hydrolase n=1 Tax=Aspergillus heteromorphus CBS 117.55 TaxID=1448321 RepID=A0A317WPX4_9EURO|nr:glycoside hydrolase [Aspergillus heteromorphus CBS 117.55]PWY88473.1 glycoside hydrolase [Aspergillus heteromorphus CBS 117.55]
MKPLVQFLVVLLLSHLTGALPYGGHDTGDGRIASRKEPLVAQVLVWVDGEGHALATSAVDDAVPTPTAANIPTDLPPLLPIPDDNAPFELSPALPDGEDGETSIPLQAENNRHYGISYSPYNDDGTCKSQVEVDKDLDKLTHYGFIRIYGVDCDQTKKVSTAARRRNMKVFAGVFDLQNFPDSLDYITRAADGDWTVFHTITIGNELVNKGQSSVADVTNAVQTARRKLRGAGYRGPVVTVDTFSVMLQHPELCLASDYCAANCHAFFDDNNTPDQAGQYAKNQAMKISRAAGGKKTIITESGWPHGGQPNGKAIPSAENQQQAIASLKQAFPDDDELILFTAFDDGWKQDSSGTFGAEKYWGIEKR